MNIIPSINGKCEQGQRLALPSPLTISQEYNAQVSLFCARMGSIGIKTQVAQSPFIQLASTASLKAEEYNIQISQNGIIVEFGASSGLNNALVTMYQLARGNELFCGTIHDYPRHDVRSIHLDTARHFFAVEEIEKIIEQASLLKINTLHWHFADDQAWRLEIKAYPLLTNYCGKQFYTQTAALQIVRYAQDRGVQIIPEFEIPAHSTALISAYPSISCRGARVKPPTQGGIFSIIMCAGKDEALQLIAKILAELCQIFTGEYFHIGGDEAPKKEWKGCPHCNKKLQQLGLNTYEQLQGYMLNFAADTLKTYGKKAICWNDCLKADNLNEDIIVQYWQHKKNADVGNERKLIFSNVATLYFDYPYCVSNLKRVYNYVPKIKGKKAKANSIVGIEAALWTERISTNEQLEYMLFPRVLALAENAWSNKRDYDTFKASLLLYYPQLLKAGINAAPLKNAEIKGFNRLWQLALFAGTMLKALVSLILPQKVEF